MTHIWVRAEQRLNEDRVGITPAGAAVLIKKGFSITVEESANRIIASSEYKKAGCRIAVENSWEHAPKDAIIFGLKELPELDTPLYHKHIMFGHAFKGQYSSEAFLQRFQKGNGSLFDLEYLVDETGRRVAAFGYWAGYAGAAISIKCWVEQQKGLICGPVTSYSSQKKLLEELKVDLKRYEAKLPKALIIGALGRVGSGAINLCEALGIKFTKWDIDDTLSGGPFPEIMDHEILINSIVAGPGTPVFVSPEYLKGPRKLTVIGDIACDPNSDYNPLPLYESPTSWTEPAVRVSQKPPLDIMAIDNLPSLLPLESSEDFAEQLLPYLMEIDNLNAGVWARALATFEKHIAGR